ncbi:hypothetical protein LH407_10580 [Antiquaquibacter oligotrophicus]|nr:hypothetical protein [Antiquaquibacter oligotrophicus]UDF12595.1 hypothetical protein LH407_10580 [Antiquaquibacter oligotrophicus]
MAPPENADALAFDKARSDYLAGDFAPTLSLGTPKRRRVAVIMCLWNRPQRMGEVLAMLAGQVLSGGIDLYLWNNCPEDHEIYEKAIRDHGLRGALRSVQLVKSDVNLGSIARFYIARKLAAEGMAGPIIILDDDENVKRTFVRQALWRYNPKEITAWWAFQVNGAYWDKTPAERGDRVDHIGPGGMICDSRIFLDDRFFTELPDKYWFLDDLWLTYWAHDKGIPLRKLDVTIDFVLKEKNQWYSLVDLKEEFYTELYGQAAGEHTVAGESS